MAVQQASLCLVFAVFMVFLCSSSQGYKFYVGGRNGWVINPTENYNHWAERNRFQVNDTLLFKFKKGEDSVLIVTKENYNDCNVNNPIKSLTEGESEYKFERSGAHYFISGNADHCNKGQKIVIVVLAVRPKKTSPPPPPASPTTPPPPSAPVQTPPPAPSAQTPPPASPSPSETPAPSPMDGPTPSEHKRNSGAVFGAPLAGVVLSVVIGVGVFLGSFGGMM